MADEPTVPIGPGPQGPPPVTPREAAAARSDGMLDTPLPASARAGRRAPVRLKSAGDEWTQQDEDRYQAQVLREAARVRTRRRQALSFFAIVLVVVLIGLLGAAINQGVIKWPFGGSSKPAVPCPTVAAVAKPSEVSVKVLNATTRKGLALAVSKELQARGYTVAQVGNAPADSRDFPDPVQVVHGPTGLAAARSVAAQIPGAVLVEDTRTDGTVDLLIGAKYTALASPADAAKALTPTSAPSPAGCKPA